MSKYRYELKYIINKDIAIVLKSKLAMVMDKDLNGLNKTGSYYIRSLYFDDLESTAYYEKVDGVEYRKKYRIRIYNNDNNFIRLECKYKCNNMTKKNQQLISYDICSKIISGNIDEIDISKSDDLLSQFLVDMRIKNIIPSIIVDYERLAYTYPVSDVRITFDSKLKSGQYNYNLFDYDATLCSMIDDEEVVLEIKFNELLPEHIQIVLETVPMFRQAFSKFAICRSIK